MFCGCGCYCYYTPVAMAVVDTEEIIVIHCIKSNQIIYLLRDKHLLTVYKN